MLYRIQIEQRFDKQKAVIEAVKELANDFVILTGMAYFGNNHRPCQIIEITFMGNLPPFNFEPCIKKLQKILNMSHILVVEVEAEQVSY